MTLPVDEVTQSLTQHQNLARIKKLLVYACSNTWENDPHQLSEYQLSDLLQKLLENAPTLEQLKLQLARMVKTLNKPAEYTLIANAIVNQMQRLYVDQPSQTAANDQQVQAITDTLQQDSDATRVKKLLWCACTQSWENDPQQLDHIYLPALIRELHQLAPTRASLKAVLASIVQTLNRQAHYKQVAQKILDAFEPLYLPTLDVTESLPNSAAARARHTEIVDSATIDTAIGKARSETIGSADLEPTVRSMQPAIPADVEPTASSAQPVAPAMPSPALPQAAPPFNLGDISPADRFNLRLEIIKYANPLRVKLLIFSTLYELLNPQDESWTALKAHEMDDLLLALLQDCRTLETLKFRLHQTSKKLAQPKDYIQVADAIVRAVQPFCQNDSQRSLGIPMPAQGTLGDEADETGLRFGKPAQENENTGQIFFVDPND